MEFREQFESLVQIFSDRKVIVEKNGSLKLSRLSMVERYVLSTAISLGRCKDTRELNADMYRMTWERNIKLCIESQREVLSGLDDYVCDTGGTIHSINDGDEKEEILIDFDSLMELNETARILFRAIEIAADKYDEINSVD